MQHGTIIRAVLTYKKILLQKSIEFGIPLSRARLVINKKHSYFSLPDYQLAQNLILIFTLYERTKKDKREFVTIFFRNCSYG